MKQIEKMAKNYQDNVASIVRGIYYRFEGMKVLTISIIKDIVVKVRGPMAGSDEYIKAGSEKHMHRFLEKIYVRIEKFP